MASLFSLTFYTCNGVVWQVEHGERGETRHPGHTRQLVLPEGQLQWNMEIINMDHCNGYLENTGRITMGCL